jgi:hypothetical protein
MSYAPFDVTLKCFLYLNCAQGLLRALELQNVSHMATSRALEQALEAQKLDQVNTNHVMLSLLL